MSGKVNKIFAVRKMSSLYVVSTPIGNLDDITLRAIQILKRVDAIACEDTRVTRKLLARCGIKTRLISCHEHNEARQSGAIVRILKTGGDVALVTDAGTPLLSDPGSRVVRRAADEGFKIVPVPGASALTCALSVSAVDFSEFTFVGFLPKRREKARQSVSEFIASPRPFVIYESPRRVAATLRLLLEILGDRSVALCREMTKIHEEILRGKISSVSEILAQRKTVKGEIVIVISGAPQEKSGWDEKQAAKRLSELKSEGMSFKDAVKTVSSEAGARKNSIYRFARKVWDGTD